MKHLVLKIALIGTLTTAFPVFAQTTVSPGSSEILHITKNSPLDTLWRTVGPEYTDRQEIIRYAERLKRAGINSVYLSEHFDGEKKTLERIANQIEQVVIALGYHNQSSEPVKETQTFKLGVKFDSLILTPEEATTTPYIPQIDRSSRSNGLSLILSLTKQFTQNPQLTTHKKLWVFLERKHLLGHWWKLEPYPEEDIADANILKIREYLRQDHQLENWWKMEKDEVGELIEQEALEFWNRVPKIPSHYGSLQLLTQDQKGMARVLMHLRQENSLVQGWFRFPFISNDKFGLELFDFMKFVRGKDSSFQGYGDPKSWRSNVLSDNTHIGVYVLGSLVDSAGPFLDGQMEFFYRIEDRDGKLLYHPLGLISGPILKKVVLPAPLDLISPQEQN